MCRERACFGGDDGHLADSGNVMLRVSQDKKMGLVVATPTDVSGRLHGENTAAPPVQLALELLQLGERIDRSKHVKRVRKLTERAPGRIRNTTAGRRQTCVYCQWNVRERFVLRRSEGFECITHQ